MITITFEQTLAPAAFGREPIITDERATCDHCENYYWNHGSACEGLIRLEGRLLKLGWSIIRMPHSVTLICPECYGSKSDRKKKKAKQ